MQAGPLPEDPDRRWLEIHELKHDGFQIVAHKDGDKIRLWSRNGRNWSAEMVAITAAVMALPVGSSWM